MNGPGKNLKKHLGKVLFILGVGNHELYAESDESNGAPFADYTTFWGKPVRYFWNANVYCVSCLMP